MKFQTGDHVLWKGECWRVRALPNAKDNRIELFAEPETGFKWKWVIPRDLAQHQIPWSFDKNLNGWVPA